MAAADTLGVRMLHLQTMEEQDREAVKPPEPPPEEGWIRQNDEWIREG